MIIHDRRLIFVHVQKTGGNSIATALGQRPASPEKHYLATELRGLYGPSVWDSYFKFGFVRNPWDRLVSWWAMIDARRPEFNSGKRLGKFNTFVLERAATFEEFLRNCDEEVADVDGRKWIYRNQLDYLAGPDGEAIVDFIGRFEFLERDFETVAQRISGAPIQLPHVNRSPHGRYMEYFTPELAEMVGARFRRDIDAFGYVFGE